MTQKLRQLDYVILTLLCGVGFWAFIIPWSAYSELWTHTIGDGIDEISFLFIFERLGENLSRLFSLGRQVWNGGLLYPATDALIYTETMALPSLLYHLVFQMGLPRLLAFNLILFFLFWTNAVSMYWCAKKFFSRPISMLLALFFTYSLIRVAHVRHEHCLPQLGFPLVVGFIVDFERRGRTLSLILAGFALALQFYFSVTLGTILLISLIPYAIWSVRNRKLLQTRWKSITWGLLTFAMVAFPLGEAYVRCSREHKFVRSLNNVIAYSANPKSYFVVPREHRYAGWLVDGILRGENGARHEKNLFIGFAGFLLVFLGVRRWHKNPDRTYKRIFYYSLLFVILVSMGRNIGLYNLLYYTVPVMKGLRTPCRFGFSYLFLICFLMGLGLQAIQTRFPKVSKWGPIFLVLAVLMYLDNQFWSPRFPIDPELAGVSDVLKNTTDRDPVLQVPMKDKDRVQAMQMYYSLIHDHPIANGYSGFLPPSFEKLLGTTYEFTEGKGESLSALMKEYGIAYLMIEKKPLPQKQIDTMKQTAEAIGFTKKHEDDFTVLYRR